MKQGRMTNISSTLAAFFRTYQNVPHTSTSKIPAKIIFGQISTHISMVVRTMPQMFAPGDRVWVHDYRPNAGKWQPGTVQWCMESLSYSVKLESGHQWKVHVDHLIHQATGCVPVLSETDLSTCIQATCIQATCIQVITFFPLGVWLASKYKGKNYTPSNVPTISTFLSKPNRACFTMQQEAVITEVTMVQALRLRTEISCSWTTCVQSHDITWVLHDNIPPAILII